MGREDEDRIRQRAYEIWQREGSRHGRDQDYWHQARREIEDEEEGRGASDSLAGGSLGAARLPEASGGTATGVGGGSVQPGGASPAGGLGAGRDDARTDSGSAGPASGGSGRSQ